VFIGLTILVDETIDESGWYSDDSDTDPRSFTGVELSKTDNGLVVSFTIGMPVCNISLIFCSCAICSILLADGVIAMMLNS